MENKKVNCNDCKYFKVKVDLHIKEYCFLDRMINPIYSKTYPNKNGECKRFKKRWFKFVDITL